MVVVLAEFAKNRHRFGLGSSDYPDSQAHLGELIDQLQDGEGVLLTRRGEQVARLTLVDRLSKPVDGDQLRALTQSMPMQSESAGECGRSMRDADRY